MKRDTVNYFYVGLAVIAAIIVLLMALLKITGRGGAVDRYSVRYQNVAGLGYGSAVLYQGYRIGQIEAITPEQTNGNTRFKVDFSVNAGWQIPKDSTAALLSSGLLSDVFVGINEGKGPGLIPPGSELKGRESADVFAAVSELAGQITELTQTKLSPLMTRCACSSSSIAAPIRSMTYSAQAIAPILKPCSSNRPTPPVMRNS
jgi:phospholipid/cholesterol/gamma-HCH transport system substrate-binding protein